MNKEKNLHNKRCGGKVDEERVREAVKSLKDMMDDTRYPEIAGLTKQIWDIFKLMCEMAVQMQSSELQTCLG